MNIQPFFIHPRAALVLALAAFVGLASAYIAQYGFGIMPCELCLWQRGPYWAGLVLALIVYYGWGPVVSVGYRLLTLVWLTSAGLALYHVGVEQHWWIHGGACGGQMAEALTPEVLREQLLALPVVRCDKAGWTLLSISIPTWNVPFSLLLAVFAWKSYGKTFR